MSKSPSTILIGMLLLSLALGCKANRPGGTAKWQMPWKKSQALVSQDLENDPDFKRQVRKDAFPDYHQRNFRVATYPR